MKVYDIYYKTVTLRLMRSDLTEEQVDKFWNTLKWWEKLHIEIRSREIDKENER